MFVIFTRGEIFPYNVKREDNIFGIYFSFHVYLKILSWSYSHKAHERTFYVFIRILGPKMLTRLHICLHVVHDLRLCTHFMSHVPNRKKYLKSNLTKQSNHILIGFVYLYGFCSSDQKKNEIDLSCICQKTWSKQNPRHGQKQSSRMNELIIYLSSVVFIFPFCATTHLCLSNFSFFRCTLLSALNFSLSYLILQHISLPQEVVMTN